MTKEEYQKYAEWCRLLNEVHGGTVIGGDHTIHITPTSCGDIVVITCRKVKKDQAGNPILKRNAKRGHLRYKYKTMKMTLRDLT